MYVWYSIRNWIVVINSSASKARTRNDKNCVGDGKNFSFKFYQTEFCFKLHNDCGFNHSRIDVMNSNDRSLFNPLKSETVIPRHTDRPSFVGRWKKNCVVLWRFGWHTIISNLHSNATCVPYFVCELCVLCYKVQIHHDEHGCVFCCISEFAEIVM